MNFLSLSCRSHLTDSSLVSSKNFDLVGRGEEAGGEWSGRGEGGKGGGGWKRKRDSVLFPLSYVVYFSFKGWFHGLAHVQAITSGHSIAFFKEKLRACESFPVKILWSVEKNAAMDVISLIGAPLTCLPFTTQFHSL